MKYGPGEQAVPDLHSSGFNLLSTLTCSCGHSISRPLGEGGLGSAEQHKGQVYLFEGVCLCVHGDSQALVMIKNV